MKYTELKKLLILVNVIAVQYVANGQSIPVGMPVLEDAYRRAQLLGKTDSSVSFTSRPIFPVQSMKTANPFDPDRTLDKERWINEDGIFHFGKGQGVIQLLPFTGQLQYNLDHPYSLNDGLMIPARGYQTTVSGGFFAKYGPLSIQFRPEYVYAQNRDFQGFYKELSDQKWYEYYQVQVFIDMPEKFGNRPYTKLSWGQSSVRLTAGPVSVGLSNENLWWGPGIRNSLVMSNSADGFLHYTLNTVKPIRTPIGSFEGQIIAGRLENSGFDVPDSTRTYLGYSIYLRKRKEWRYINAMEVSYQPKWIPGLFLGITRSFTKYGSEKDSSFQALFPIFFPMQRKNNYDDPLRPRAGDQRESLFIRWLLVPEHAEIYWEYMREDPPYNWRDLILQPGYSRGYIFGLRKLIPLRKREGECIQVDLELTQLEQTNANPNYLYRYLYTSQVIYHGYTNNGQLLGAGIGPGSNMQTFSVSWVKDLKLLGIRFERFVHNEDFQNTGIKDIRANWVDLSATGIVEWNWHNLLLSARLENILSFNYQHYYRPKNPNSGEFFEPGINRYNFQAQLGISYRF